MQEELQPIEESEFVSEEVVEHFYSHAYAQYNAGNWEKAGHLFAILCTQKPFEGRFWYGLGASMQEAKRYDDALKAWAQTALLMRENPYPHFFAAGCLISSNNLTDAALALREAQQRIAADPTHPLKEGIDLLKTRWSL